MIEITQGNLLDAPVEALVNTVNTAGIMGKGIALQFKQAYPVMFQAYARACKAGEVQLGRMQVFDNGGLLGGPRWIINFPTKGHWRAASRLEDIEAGLQDLAATVRRLNIQSIAVPPLGCGNGGLNWNDVLPRIRETLGALPEVRVLVFAPGAVPPAQAMPNRTARPPMTVGRAALILLIDRYLKGLLDPFVTLLEVHKLMYFLQMAGQPLKLQYEARKFGPYATNLRQVLIRLERHYTQGYGDGEDDPSKPIELLPGAVDAAAKLLHEHPDVMTRMDRVARLIDGFEDPHGLELLSSVHWVLREHPEIRDNVSAVIGRVHAWNDRKREVLKPDHIAKAWNRLRETGWDETSSWVEIPKAA